MMNKEGRNLASVWVGIIFVIILIGGIIIIAQNINLKKKFSKFQSPAYVWKAEELARISRKHHPDAVVVLNEEQGVWAKNVGLRIEMVQDLTLGEKDEDEHYVFYGGGDVIADDAGNIYVLLRKEGVIRKFDAKGRYLLTIGREGQGPGELLQPVRAVIDRRDVLHVIEYGNRRVSRFDLNGHYLGCTLVQFQRIPRQFGVDDNGNYYISFLNEENGTVIHQFDAHGKLVKSFGEPLYLTREIHFAERGSIVEDCSQGHIFADQNFLYFCRWNPYDIRKYTYDGKLTMLIFRKNHFMPPDQMKIMEQQRYRFYPSVHTAFISNRNDQLICLISVPEIIYKEINIGWIVDIFDLNGNLLTSYQSPLEFYPTFMDNHNRIYGFSGDLTRIYRFTMKITRPKSNERR